MRNDGKGTPRSPRTPRTDLTRRRFLEQLGAVGGSSLVMTAMNSWDLMARDAGQRPALTGRPAGPELSAILAALPKEEALRRVDQALQHAQP